MQITMQGKYQTEDGRPVEILRTGLYYDGPFNVLGIIWQGDGKCIVEAWTPNGKTTHKGIYNNDLVPVPEPKPVVHQMWAVMEDGSDTIKYSSYCKQDAEWHCNVFLHETMRLIQWNT